MDACSDTYQQNVTIWGKTLYSLYKPNVGFESPSDHQQTPSMRGLLILTVTSVVAGNPQITATSLGLNPAFYGSKTDYLGGLQITADSLGLNPAYYGSKSDYLGGLQITADSLGFNEAY